MTKFVILKSTLKSILNSSTNWLFLATFTTTSFPPTTVPCPPTVNTTSIFAAFPTASVLLDCTIWGKWASYFLIMCCKYCCKPSPQAGSTGLESILPPKLDWEGLLTVRCLVTWLCSCSAAPLGWSHSMESVQRSQNRSFTIKCRGLIFPFAQRRRSRRWTGQCLRYADGARDGAFADICAACLSQRLEAAQHLLKR